MSRLVEVSERRTTGRVCWRARISPNKRLAWVVRSAWRVENCCEREVNCSGVTVCGRGFWGGRKRWGRPPGDQDEWDWREV